MVVYYGKATPASGSGGGSGDVDWGDIGGTLSDQTDLAAALAEKQDVIDSTHKLSASLVDGLATVATTGAYGDLSGTPTIPTVNDATLTVKQNNTSVGTFTANASSDVTLNLTDTTYSAFTGATGSVAGSAGLVPAPTATDNDKYLKGDGTWAAVSGGSLPSQTGNNGKYLTTDGTDASWATVPAGLQNTAMGTNSLNILGYVTDKDNTISIGYNSSANADGVCIGVNSGARNYSVTIGNGISNYYSRCIQIGYQANAQSNDTTVIGYQASVGDDSNYSMAIGHNAIVENVKDAIQIGYGTNNTANSLFVGFYDTVNQVGYGNYQLLDGTTGLIPTDRLTVMTGADGSNAGTKGAVPAPTATDNDKYLKGDGTWAAVSGGSLPSQTGNNGKYLTTDGTNASWATISSSGIQNTATGTNSLTILGTATTRSNAINIGVGSSATNNEAIAIGNTSQASGDLSIAIGTTAKATQFGSTAYGEASQAIGSGTLAIGAIAVASGTQSYQIGWGTNSTDKTLCVGWGVNSNYKLLDGTTGKIPNDRIDGATGSFTSQDGKTVTVTNGVITSIV